MKILLVNSLYSPNIAGGAERSVQMTAEALKSLGLEPVIVSSSDRSAVGYVNDIKVYYQRIPNLYWMRQAKEQASYKKPLWHLLDARNPFAAGPIAKILSQERPALIHTNNLSGFSVKVWDVASRLSIPVVHTIRDHYLLCLSTTMYRNGDRCEKQCMRCRVLSRPKKNASASVDAVVGVSRSILDSHLKLGFFGAARIKKYIYNPVVVSSVPARTKSDTAPCVFGYVGQLDPSKGVEHLLEGFRRLNPAKASLRVFGRGTTSAFEEKLIQTYKSSSIEFLGFRPPEEIYPELDVVVVPSLRDEAFGRIVPEANSYGLPVIVSNRGGLPEIVRDGVNGYVFDPASEGDLEAKLGLFAEEPSRSSQMADRCRACATSYRADKIAAQYLEIYNELIS
ncbi:MAG: glycosyltransferase family 4 protein [bacterium]|nr:glycosyltransferase family 4 protein [bacterium]